MNAEATQAHRLACLELRGGNHLATYAAELPGLAGWVSCRPLQPAASGGDMYYLSACSKGVVARVVLADVAGHGAVVSSAAMLLRDTLREHLDCWDQSMLIRRLNDSFLTVTADNRYATAFLASYYSVSGELLFTNAGHLPPLWYRAARDEWSLLIENTPYSKQIVDLPLGLIAGTHYTQMAVQLEPGDLLLLYTDGISEASDDSGEQLGLDRLLTIAKTLPTGSSAAAGQSLLSAVENFRNGTPPTDDETIVALHRLAV
ncbi:MAG: PP2C family protein-serine/threonine phosphatase [Bryobacteraceae bacterium]